MDYQNKKRLNAAMYVVSSADKAHGYYPSLAERSPQRAVLSAIVKAARLSADRLLQWMQRSDGTTAEGAFVCCFSKKNCFYHYKFIYYFDFIFFFSKSKKILLLQMRSSRSRSCRAPPCWSSATCCSPSTASWSTRRWLRALPLPSLKSLRTPRCLKRS